MDSKRAHALLAGSPPFDVLPPLDVERAVQRSIVKSYRRGECVFDADEDARSVWCVIDGAVMVTAQHGLVRTIVGLHTPGELFGRFEDPVRAEALCDSDVLEMPRAVYEALVNGRPAASAAMTRILARRLSEANALRAMLRRPVRQRLALLLLWLDRKFAGRVPFTRLLLAELAGAAPATVIRALSPLEKKGWIRSARDGIRILEPTRVARLGDPA